MTKQTKKQSDKTPVETQEFNIDECAATIAGQLKDAANHVIESTDVGNLLAVFDTGDLDTEAVADEAADWVYDNLIGALPYNILAGMTYGRKMISQAESQVANAAKRASARPSVQNDDQLLTKIRWNAKMECQQAYREAFKPLVLAIYKAIFDAPYIYQGANNPTNDEAAQTAAMEVAKRVAARRKAS